MTLSYFPPPVQGQLTKNMIFQVYRCLQPVCLQQPRETAFERAKDPTPCFPFACHPCKHSRQPAKVVNAELCMVKLIKADE